MNVKVVVAILLTVVVPVYAQAQSSSVPNPRKEYFDLNVAINEVIVLGRSAVIKNGVSVQTRLSEGLFPVHGDRVQLQQVVLNLLLNAVEAMGSREAAARELLISTEQDHTGVLVPGPASIRRISSACSMHFTPRSPAAWGWGCRFAGLSSTPRGAGCGQRPMNLAALYFSLPCPPSRESCVKAPVEFDSGHRRHIYVGD
jgi:hypothetical protein